ncbi:acyl carrier protein [Thalassotalea marina]|uniref:Acyl carrier protein n=1 Tax=Thalassotalea marina TaxID=1673741 RepID=A0A919EHW5_9GAMM|nr:acyl carrier protein [Thalassotalea marina]GHF80379.1 acyl carrier protein [Thalassotalea marina]
MPAQQTLIEAFAVALEIEPQEVVDSLTYSEHPKWDSTAHMILVAQLEADFDVMFEIDDIIDMSSVKKAKEILTKYQPSLSFDG